VIGPDERLPAGQTLLAGIQHVVAMFGSTAIAPILMGFHPNIAILFSGIGTLLFFLFVRGRVPGYLGSSFGVHRRCHRGHWLCGQWSQSQYSGAGHHRGGRLIYGHRPRRAGSWLRLGGKADAAGRDWCDRRGNRPEPGAGGGQGGQRCAARYLGGC
jgi:hypothetical protein